jgi:hypothetical protein
MVGGPATGHPPAGELDPTALGELEGVREQVLEHLQQALGVGVDRPSEVGIEGGAELDAAPLGLVTERALHQVREVREGELLALDRDRAGFDLRQVEDVADQVQQVGAGAVDRLGELDLALGERALGVLGELLAEDEDAVEGGPQLVRHVGE